MSKESSSHKTSSPLRGFTPSVVAVCALVGVGFVLQLLLGPMNFRLLASPINLVAGGAMVLLCTAAALFADSPTVRWFTGLPMAVCLIAGFCILALVMGLTPQGAIPMGGVARMSARLGFNAMTSSWPFVLVYFALLLSLGGLVARRLARFKARDWGFYLNHIGLWLVLFAAGLGHADLERYMMSVDEGAAEMMGYDTRTGHPRRLPLEVRLRDFIMEEYPSASPGARPEPKRFASDIVITTSDGRTVSGVTEVNHPLKAGSWMVYQYGYDREAGPDSKYSILELVRDPLLNCVYVGFAMLAVGAVAMIWTGRRAKKTGTDDGLE